jgi:hypothetical protein
LNNKKLLLELCRLLQTGILPDHFAPGLPLSVGVRYRAFLHWDFILRLKTEKMLKNITD